MAQFATRQLQMTLPAQNQIVIEHDVHVERAGAIACAATDATVTVFQRVQPVVQRLGCKVAVDRHGQGAEIGAIETDGRAAIHRRDIEFTEAGTQFRHRGGKPALGIDIGAKTQVGTAGSDHSGRVPRSMRTPTDLAPRTAPGLDSFNRTQATPNSSRTIPAQRSASVSTSPKLDASTYDCRRLEMDL